MSSLGEVRTIVLDLDDTLIVEESTAHASLELAAGQVPDLDPEQVRKAVLTEARRRWRAGPYATVCAELGIASWEGLWSTFEGCHPRLAGLREWAPDYRRRTWQAALASLGVDEDEGARACADAYIAAQRRGHPLIEGTEPTVRALARDYRLGLLTNGPSDIQRLKLEATGLGDLFDAVVVSGEEGVAKPDPAVFTVVLDRLGGDPETTVMVGDSWDRDVVGAEAAGWRAVWISDGRPSPDPDRDVPSVRGVAELPDLLT